MYFQPKSLFTGKLYPSKSRIQRSSTPKTGNQQSAVDGEQKEMHHHTPRRTPQSGGKSNNKLCHITEIEEKNISLQEQLEQIQIENQEMWKTFCYLEDRLKNQSDRHDLELRMVILESEETQNCLLKKYARKRNDEYEKNSWISVWQRKLEEKDNELKQTREEVRQLKERKHNDEYEKKSWRRKLEEKDEELNKTREEISQLKERINELNYELQQVLKSKSQQYIDLENELARERCHAKEDIYHSQFQSILDEKERELSDLNQEMTRINQENTILSWKIDTLNKKQESNQKMLAAANEENAKLQNKVYDLERHMRETKTDDEKIKEISTEKQRLELVIKSLSTQVSEWKTRYHNIEGERKTDLESKSEKEQSYERQLIRLKREVEKLNKEKEDMTVEIDNLTVEKETQSQNYYEAKGVLAVHLKKQQERCDAQKAEIDRLQRDLYRFQKEKEQWQQQESHFRLSTVTQYEAEMDKLKSKLTTETASQNKKVESVMKEKQDLERELTNLRSRANSQGETKERDLEKLRSELHLKDKQLERKEGEYETLKSKLTSETLLNRKIESVMKEKQDLDRELTDVKSRYQQDEIHLKAKLRKQQDDNEKQKNEIQSLQQNIHRLQNTTEEWQLEKRDTMSRNQSEYEEIKKLLQAENHKNLSLKTEVQELKQAIQETERECQELQDQNQQLLLKRDSNTQEYQQLSAAAKSENETLQREIIRLKKVERESSQKATSLAHLTDKAEKLENEYVKLEARNRDLNVQIQDLNTRSLRQVQVAKQQKNDLDSKARECKKYKNEVSALKEKLERKTSFWQEEKETYQKLCGVEDSLHCVGEITDTSISKSDRQSQEKDNTSCQQKVNYLEAILKKQQEEIRERDAKIDSLQKELNLTLQQNEELRQISLSSSIMKTAQVVVSVKQKAPFNPVEKLNQIFESVCAHAELRKSSNENQAEDDEVELDTISTLKDLFHQYYLFFENKTETTGDRHTKEKEEDEEILEILPIVRKQAPNFAKECIELCREIARHNPPLILMFDKGMKKGSQINKDMFDCYKESGDLYKCVVWPALISKSDGAVYRKGLVKPLKT